MANLIKPTVMILNYGTNESGEDPDKTASTGAVVSSGSSLSAIPFESFG